MIRVGAISILLISIVYSQVVTISGSYLDHKSNPISNASVKYFQSLVLIDSTTTAVNGEFNLTVPIVGIEDDALPAAYNLSQNYPNPFNPVTRIDITTLESGTVTIYNILGQTVDQTILPTAGEYSLTWGGGNAFGKSVSAGIYFYVLRSGDHAQVRKMTLLDKGNGTRLGIASFKGSEIGDQLSKTTSWDELAFTKSNTSTLLLNLETPSADTSLGVITGNVGPELIQQIADTTAAEGDTLFMDWDQYFYNDNTTLYSESIYTAPHAGLYNMQVFATDSVDTNLTAVSNVFIVEVYHINLPPIINLPDTLNLLEDQAPGYLLDLTDYCTDPENGTLVYSITYQQHPEYVNMTLFGDSLSLDSLMHNWNGAVEVGISVSDGEYSVNDTISLIVNSVNDAPYQTNDIPAQAVDEDSSLQLVFSSYASDVEGDSLRALIDTLPNASYSVVNDTITITPNADYNGVIENIILNISDGVSSVNLSPFNLTVNSVNDAPYEVGVIGSQTVDEGQTLDLTLRPNFVQDIDSDTLQFLVDNPNLSSETVGDTLRLTPNSGYSGLIEDIVVNVSDGQASINLTPFSMTVNNVNYAPSIIVPNQTVAEDTLAHTIISNLNDYASDADGDELLFSLLGANNDIGLEVLGNQLNLTSLTPEFNGQAQYGVVASDGVLSDTSYFNLIVDPRGDKVFLFKQVSSDTLLTSGTSTLILNGAEYNSNNGVVQLQVTPGSYELDGTHTNSLDHDMPTWATYTFIRRLGDNYNLEQRAHLDNSSQVYLDAQDDTLQIYELLMDFPIDDVIATADEYSEGIRRFAPSVIDSIPVWLNLNYEPLDSTQRAWTDSLFAELKRIPHMKDFNFVIYEGTQQPTRPYAGIVVDESIPGQGTNSTTYNANHEVTVASAAYPVSPSPSMHTWYIEILQAINDLTDIGGVDPDILDATGPNDVWLNELGKKLYSLTGLADPHTKL